MAKISKSSGEWCGELQEDLFVCPKCGDNEIFDRHKFCPMCGEPIEWVE